MNRMLLILTFVTSVAVPGVCAVQTGLFRRAAHTPYWLRSELLDGYLGYELRGV